MVDLVFIGFGGVGQAFFELNTIFRKFTFKNLTIIEPKDLDQDILEKIVIPMTHVKLAVTSENVERVLKEYVRRGNLVIDVSFNVYFEPLISYCIENKVMYINTSMERWPLPNESTLDSTNDSFYNRTLHSCHLISTNMGLLSDQTVILEHGMNPGLISHFVKLGVEIVTKKVLDLATEKGINNRIIEKLREGYNGNYTSFLQDKKDYAKLAHYLGLETIHCSELDTQKPYEEVKQDNKFLNTWGSYPLYSEGVDPVQIGFGTHEDPIDGMIKSPVYDNQIFLKKRGIDIGLESYVPSNLFDQGQKIKGLCISHGENDTISGFLTYHEDGKTYQTSNYYVYSPCEEAQKALEQIKKDNYELKLEPRPLKGYEIESGADIVGGLLIFKHDPIEYIIYGRKTEEPRCFWSGSILSIEDTRKMGFLLSGPTTVQVAASLVAAINWMIKNPEHGVTYPEDIPHSEILGDCKQWLGTIFTDFVRYSPKSTKLSSFLLTELKE